MVAAVLLLGVGCREAARPAAESPSGPAGAQARPTKVTLLLNWFPEVEHGGFYAADVHGYFREAGLEVTIVPGGPRSAVVEQVAGGKFAFGVTNADNLLFGQAQGAQAIALLAPLETSPRSIMVHESSGIRRFEDLRNVTLAMKSGAAFEQFLRKRLPLENVRIVPYGGSVAPFLQDDRYAQQAYVFSEPYVAEKNGAKVRNLMLADLGFNPYTSLLIARQKSVKEQPALVRKMVRASQKGWAHYLREPGPTNRRLQEVNPEMDLDVLAFGAKAIRKLAGNNSGGPPGGMTVERWQQLEQQLVDTGQLKPGQTHAGQAFTNEFLDRVRPTHASSSSTGD